MTELAIAYSRGGGVMTVDEKRHGFIIDLDDQNLYVLWMPTDDVHAHSRAMPTLKPAGRPGWAERLA